MKKTRTPFTIFWVGVTMGSCLTAAVFLLVRPGGESPLPTQHGLLGGGSSESAGSGFFSSGVSRTSTDTVDYRKVFAQAQADDQVELLRRDPGYVAHLLDEYESTAFDDRRAALLALLTYAPNARVKAAGLSLLGRKDTRSHRLGLALLTNFQRGDVAVAKAVYSVFKNTPDDRLTLDASRLLIAKADLNHNERQAVEGRVREMLHHTNHSLRADAISQYTRLQGLQPVTLELLLSALSDQSSLVQMSAFAAIGQLGARTPDIKKRALALLTNPGTDHSVRREAAALLNDYNLTAVERSFVRRESKKLP